VARTLSITHSQQETETGCLAACAQMVLDHLGIQVRVEDEQGQTWGTGSLVGPDLAATCAHVVWAAGAGWWPRVTGI